MRFQRGWGWKLTIQSGLPFFEFADEQLALENKSMTFLEYWSCQLSHDARRHPNVTTFIFPIVAFMVYG
jgi:hypothetical protein